jgi:predicted nucleic-acid-binding protein
VNIIVDTNVLVRMAVRDDEEQWRAAATALENAELIVIPLSCLCEAVWVMRGVYRFSKEEILTVLYPLLDAGRVVLNRPAFEAGLAILEAGGDFADGVIAHEGSMMGGETFVSFDEKAVSLISKRGQPATLLS